MATRTTPLLACLLALAGPVFAQDKAPSDGIETIRSNGVREIETVISRAGWHLIGRTPEGYRIGSGTTPGMTGSTALFLQGCDARAMEGHGALERTISGTEYAGKRIRVAGRVKTQGRKGYSIFYMNAIGPQGVLLRHINLQNNSQGEWEDRTLVMDMPQSTVAIDIGVTLFNVARTTVWLDPVTIEIVDGNVSSSGHASSNVFERPMDDTAVSCDGDRDGVRSN